MVLIMLSLALEAWSQTKQMVISICCCCWICLDWRSAMLGGPTGVRLEVLCCFGHDLQHGSAGGVHLLQRQTPGEMSKNGHHILTFIDNATVYVIRLISLLLLARLTWLKSKT